MGLGRPDWLKFLTLDLFPLPCQRWDYRCVPHMWLDWVGQALAEVPYELRCMLRWKPSTLHDGTVSAVSSSLECHRTPV